MNPQEIKALMDDMKQVQKGLKSLSTFAEKAVKEIKTDNLKDSDLIKLSELQKESKKITDHILEQKKRFDEISKR